MLGAQQSADSGYPSRPSLYGARDGSLIHPADEHNGPDEFCCLLHDLDAERITILLFTGRSKDRAEEKVVRAVLSSPPCLGDRVRGVAQGNVVRQFVTDCRQSSVGPPRMEGFRLKLGCKFEKVRQHERHTSTPTDLAHFFRMAERFGWISILHTEDYGIHTSINAELSRFRKAAWFGCVAVQDKPELALLDPVFIHPWYYRALGS